MSTVTVPIEPRTLCWAMSWVGVDEQSLAKRLNVKPEQVHAWREGRDYPTYRQALKLAQQLKMGLGQLLLPPPELKLPLQDFRRGSKRGTPPSPELLEAVYDALRKRDWLRERRRQPLRFVGTARRRGAEEVAREIAQTFSVRRLQESARSPEEFLSKLVEQVEETGIIVLRQGHVGANTSRIYDPKEFSGFAVVDAMAPIIFLNARESAARQVFTLTHELAHVWRGEGGVEAELEGEPPASKVETWADRVAAETLMPADVFVKNWKRDRHILQAAEEASRNFKVSQLAALTRARSQRLVSEADYQAGKAELNQRARAQRAAKKSGGNFWRTFAIQNSRAFVKIIRDAAEEGDLDIKEVSTLLNLNVSTALKFLERPGI